MGKVFFLSNYFLCYLNKLAYQRNVKETDSPLTQPTPLFNCLLGQLKELIKLKVIQAFNQMRQKVYVI